MNITTEVRGFVAELGNTQNLGGKMKLSLPKYF